MTYRFATAIALMCFTALLSGCIGGTVQAVAPARESHLTATAPESGSYTLYRATGLDRNSEPTLEKIWSVSLMNRQPIGFKWVVSKQHEWDAQSGFHLVAYAGSDSRDLGPVADRGEKYAWAGQGDDVMGFFHNSAVRQAIPLEQINDQ